MKKISLILALIGLLFSLTFPAVAAGEISLQQCLDLAMEKNPQIAAARENANAAAARIGQASSLAIPNISFSGSLGRNYVQPTVIKLPPEMGGGSFSTSPDKAADVSSYSFNLNQNLFTGGRIIQAISTSRLAYDAAQKDLEKTANEVICNVTEAYYQTLKAKKWVEIVAGLSDNLRRHAQQTKIFAESGLATKADLLRSEVAVANMEVLQIQAQGGEKLARLSLQAAIGEKLPADKDLADLDLKYFDPTVKFSGEAADIAFANRPDWLAYEMVLKIASDAVVYSYGGYLPNLAYTYSSGRSKSEYEGTTTSYDLGNWRSLLVASWNIFDGFATPSRVREAYAQLNAAKAQRQSIRDGILLEVSAAEVSLQSARERLAAAENAEALGKKAMLYTEVAYKAQAATNTAYLDAVTAYHQAELELWSARYEIEIARAKLNKAVGKKIV